MATIYRFIVENKAGKGGEGRKSSENAPSKKSPAKKGRWVSVLGGEKGGVEHNRKLRAINPLLNRATGGAWEKGMRLGRAGMGLVQVHTETGALGLSAVSIAIIMAFVIQTLLKWQEKERAKAKQLNAQNYKMLENGIGHIRGEYDITVNIWNNRTNYNQNK